MMPLISSLYNKFYGKFLKIVNFKVGIPMLHILMINVFQGFLRICGRICEGAGKSNGGKPCEWQWGDTAGNTASNVKKFLAKESPRIAEISQSIF